MEGLTIGKLAKQAELGIETVRFYEKQGLIAPPPRTKSNYRLYPEADIIKLRFIKRAKTLGFSLNEIKELIPISHDPHATKADIKNRAVLKTQDIKKKIHDLSRIKNALELLTGECDGHGSLDDCPILRALVDDNIECEHH